MGQGFMPMMNWSLNIEITSVPCKANQVLNADTLAVDAKLGWANPLKVNANGSVGLLSHQDYVNMADLLKLSWT